MLLSAVVNEAGDFAAKFFSVDNHIDKAVLQHKLSRLKALRQFPFYGLGDSSRTCKADKRAGFCYYAIAQHRIARCYSAGCRVGQDRYEKSAGLIEFGYCGGSFGHLAE